MKQTLTVQDRTYTIYSLEAAGEAVGADFSRLPRSLKVLLENVIRSAPDDTARGRDAQAFAEWLEKRTSGYEIGFQPSRILMQDFTGVPAVVDLAAMRDAVHSLGGDPKRVNPLIPVDLVIDHSLKVDQAGTPDACAFNVQKEMERNLERYELLKWAQHAFDTVRIVPPGTGICHQVNIEFLATVVNAVQTDGETLAFPDTLVGTDSHTTMANGLAVLGWGVGGIEAEAAMLGQRISMRIPDVIGVRLSG
jgi:aconitate hydratase